jgi:phasin family protein
MADETKQAIDAAADTGKAAVEAAGATATNTAETAKAASKRSTKAAKRTTKVAATRAAKTSPKSNTRRGKSPRRTARPAAAAKRPARAASNERTNTVTYSANDWFAAFAPTTASPFQAFFAQAGERSQDVARRSQQIVEQFADLTRGNVEALVESGRVAVEGARSLGKNAVDSGRENIEQVADAVRSLAEAKSATEFMQLQTELARTSFDRMVNESSRLTESMVKLAGEALQPISNRASETAERINKLVA